MKQIFDKPQLKKGTYRAFIYEEGSIVVIPTVPNEDDMYLTSATDFATKVYNELMEFSLTFDGHGGSRTIERMSSEGFEEVVI